jgi:hypothetical protein
MKLPFVCDGTWTPYASIDFPLLVELEIVTFILETLMLFVWNLLQRRRQQWRFLDIITVSALMNGLSFAFGLTALIWMGKLP